MCSALPLSKTPLCAADDSATGKSGEASANVWVNIWERTKVSPVDSMAAANGNIPAIRKRTLQSMAE